MLVPDGWTRLAGITGLHGKDFRKEHALSDGDRRGLVVGLKSLTVIQCLLHTRQSTDHGRRLET